MKAIKYSVGLLLSLIVFGFSNDTSCIHWDKNFKLSWSDFKGLVPPFSEHGAMASCAVKSDNKVENDSVLLIIFACFSINHSWVIKEKATEYGLNHEQRHFDIAEIHARKFRKYLYEWNKQDNINDYILTGNELIVVKSLNAMEELYDLETNHSINKNEQGKWDRKIDSLLNVYSAYENPIVKLPRHK